MIVKDISYREEKMSIPLGKGLYMAGRAADMTQTSRRNLSDWSKSGLIIPHIHYGDSGPAIYSYHDLLSIRALVRFRQVGLPLAQITKATGYFYRELETNPDWIHSRIVLDDQDFVEIILGSRATAQVKEITTAYHDGREKVEIAFADVADDLLQGGRLADFPEIKGFITIDGHIQGGAPVIKETRIETSVVYMWNQRGLTTDNIARMYNGLTTEAINAAVKYEDIITANL